MNYQYSPFWPVEGELLTQHSLQHDALVSLNSVTKKESTKPNNWGIIHLNIDNEALSVHRIKVNQLLLQFQSGIWIYANQNAEIKEKSFEHLANGTSTVIPVYLGIKHINTEKKCIQDENDDSQQKILPFVSQDLTKVDLNTGKNDHNVKVLVWNVIIFFEKPSADEFQSIKIAQIILPPNGDIPIIDHEYIPPLLNINASDTFKIRLNNILNRLHKHYTLLKDQLIEKRSLLTADPFYVLNDHMMSGALLSSIYVLEHLNETQNTHPQYVYIELLRLAGFLSSLCSNVPVNIPSYNHNELTVVLNELIEQISRLLRGGHFSEFIGVNFENSGNIFSCLIDQTLFDQNPTFYLCVDSESSEREVDEIFNISKIKIAPKSKLAFLYQHKMAGFLWERIRRPPQGMQDRNGLHYFRLNISKESTLWQTLINVSELGIMGLAKDTSFNIRLYIHIQRKEKKNESK